MDDRDRLLKNFLRASDRPVDEQFVETVHQQVLIEQQLAVARARAWARFGFEVLASAAVLLMITAVAMIADAPAGSTELQPALPPGTFALLLFALWAAAALRPASHSAT